jgi:tetratricopeptide (TPR) repeat protein
LHRQNIVHRDLKPANVMRVGDAWKLSDFGTVRQSAGDVTSRTGVVMGTWTYMPPESFSGVVSPAWDLWSLGVLLFQCVAGQVPFAPIADQESFAAIQHQEPVLPAGTGQRYGDIIRGCLAKDYRARWSARQVTAALAAMQNTTAEPERSPASSITASLPSPAPAVRFGKRAKALLLALVLLACVGLAWFLGRGGAAAPAVPSRPSVAVLQLKNLAVDPRAEWLSTGLSEMLSTELAAGSAVRAIAGDDIGRMRVDLGLRPAESFPKDSLARMRRILGADFVVTGSYATVGGRIRLDLRIQNSISGDVIAAIVESGGEQETFDVVHRAGARLRNALGAGEVTPAERNQIQAAFPANPAAARLYAEGLEKLRSYDSVAARASLEQSIAAEPDNALVHAALARTWSTLGNRPQAAASAKRAFELSGKLPREEKLLVEAEYRSASRQFDQAIDIYKALATMFPDHLDYALRLAGAQKDASRGKEAMLTIAALRKLPVPARDDARIDLTETQVAQQLSDYRRMLEAARRAAAKARVSSARNLLAKSRLLEGIANRSLGDSSQAWAAFEEAKRITSELGDRNMEANILNITSASLAEQGKLREAIQGWEQAEAIYRTLGEIRGVAMVLENIGYIRAAQGDLQSARKAYQEALRLDQQLGDRQGIANVLINLGETSRKIGDLTDSHAKFEEALRLARQMGGRSYESEALLNLGLVAAIRGRLGEAQPHYENALAILRETQDRRGIPDALARLADLKFAQGDLAGAQKLLDEAAAICRSAGRKLTEAEISLRVASIELERDRGTAAEQLARQSLEVFQAEKAVASESVGYEILARSLLSQSRTGPATQAAVRALEKARQAGDPILQLDARITAARILTAERQFPQAQQDLERVLAESSKAGFVRAQLECRLALAESETAAGATGESRLAQVESDARRWGFGLLAMKAAKLRR